MTRQESVQPEIRSYRRRYLKIPLDPKSNPGFFGQLGPAQNPYLFSFFLTLVLLGFQLFFFRPFFEVNDETFKIFFTKGVGSDLVPNEFVGYSNILLGCFLKTAYNFATLVPWYGLVLLSAQFLGVWLFIAALSLRPAFLFKTILFLAGALGTLFILFHSLQFTIASSLATQGSLFLLVTLLESEDRKGKGWGLFLSCSALVFASLIRLDALLFTLVCALPFLAVFIRKNGKRLGERRINVPILVTAALILIGALFNHYWYERDPGWKAFNRFDHERVEFQDYRIHAYDPTTQPFFDAAKWSENDFEMFKDWYFMDSDKYDWANIDRLKRHFPRMGLRGKPSSYHSLVDIFFDPNFGGMSLVLILCLFLFCPSKRIPLYVTNFAWVTLFFLYLLYFWRAPERVVHPGLAYLVSLGIFLAEPPQELFRSSGRTIRQWKTAIGILFLAIALLSCLPRLGIFHKANQDQVLKETELKSQLARLNPNDDQLFVVWDSSFPYELFDALDDFETFRHFHIFTLAVYQRCPNAQRLLEHFRLKNLFMDMVDRPDVFLICSEDEVKRYWIYMMENHHLRTRLPLVFSCNLFNVYRVVSADSKAKK
jgi:hypothetical protein